MENLPAVQVKTFGITPQSIDGAIKLAKIFAASGLMPKALNSPEAVFVAMQMGAEIGLSPMASVQNISVINGRPGIFGDAALAVVRASGLLEEFREWSEGTRKAPDWTYFCRIKRQGFDATTGSYSWAEACEAGQDRADNLSPWKKWTNRMMQFKARNFPMRDQFADILKGIRTIEENVDAIEMDSMTDGNGNPQYQVKADAGSVQESASDLGASAFDLAAEERYPDEKVRERLKDFVAATAGHHGVSDDVIKDRAMNNWDGFATAFDAWKAKATPDQEAALVPEEAIEVGGSQVPQVERPSGPPSAASVWADFRAKYINLKTASYEMFVNANKELFGNCPKEMRDEAVEKFNKIYPGRPCPIGYAPAGVKVSAEPEKQPERTVAEYMPPGLAVAPVITPAEQTLPLSCTRQYKDLMEFKNEFPTLYSQARITLAIGSDTIENCTRLHALMEKLVEQQITDEINTEENAPPDEIDEFNQF